MTSFTKFFSIFILDLYFLNLMIGRNEPKNLQIFHNKNVTLDSCGVNSLSTKQEVKKTCFRWHKTIAEQKNELKNIEYGTDAQIGEFPYTVLILIIKPHYNMGMCTGTIINEYWIITAAHCIEKYSTDNLRIYPGISDYTHSSITFDEADRLFIHESYNETDSHARWYDIGLIKMKQKIHINRWSRANSVCLPAPGFQIDTPELAMFTGWGFINDTKRNIRRLQKTQIKLSVEYRFNHIAIVSNYIIKGKPCTGDSGGPLVQYLNGRAVLIGLLKSTWDDEGKTCGPISRIYFSSVPFFMKWIIEKIQNN